MTTVLPVPADRIFNFLRHLRDLGFSIGVGESSDIFEVITSTSQPDPALAKTTLRALCCRNHDEWLQFDTYFHEFWFPQLAPIGEQSVVARIDSRQRAQGNSKMAGIAGNSSESSESGECDGDYEGRGAGRQRTVGKADFRFLGDAAAMREAGKLAEQLGLELRKNLSRRRQPTTHGGQLDLRRTLRCSIATGGFPARLHFSNRKIEAPHLIVLHDVSHSMTWNNPLLFRFVRGLVQTFSQTVAYGFHTKLFPLTRFLRESSLQRMRSRLERQNGLWMGGTCIAKSIQTYNQRYRARDYNRRSVVIIISDGFDTDDQSMLDQELNILKSGAKKLLWLNPMLGRPGVTLDPVKLKAALPMVHRFLPANSVDALRATIREIGRY